MDELRRATLLLLLLLLLLRLAAAAGATSDGSDPSPRPWPERFHALLYMNLTATGELMVTDLYYDWPRGRSVHLMQRQLDDLLYNVEWGNGTSFYYTLGPTAYCHPRQWGIGLPRPDWLLLRPAPVYLGRRRTGGILCHVWNKVDFAWYYEDVETGRPVRWDFFDGVTNYVMTFEAGASLNDSKQWQAPSYCFGSGKDVHDDHIQAGNGSSSGVRDANVIANLSLRRFV